MRGTFRTDAFSYYDIISSSNSNVLIVVGSKGQPTGIWRGVISEIENKTRLTYGEGSTREYQYYCGCTALIKDERAPKEWYSEEPSHDYYAVAVDEAFPLILGRIDHHKCEINGLKKNHAIEINALHAAFRAMVSKENAETILDITEQRKMSDAEAIEKLDMLIKFFKEDFRSWLDAIDKQNGK